MLARWSIFLFLIAACGCSYTILKEIPPDPLDRVPDSDTKIEHELLDEVLDFHRELDAKVPYKVALRHFRESRSETDSLGRIRVHIHLREPDQFVRSLILESGGKPIEELEQTDLDVIGFVFPETIRFFAKISTVLKIGLFRKPWHNRGTTRQQGIP